MSLVVKVVPLIDPRESVLRCTTELDKDGATCTSDRHLLLPGAHYTVRVTRMFCPNGIPGVSPTLPAVVMVNDRVLFTVPFGILACGIDIEGDFLVTANDAVVIRADREAAGVVVQFQFEVTNHGR